MKKSLTKLYAEWELKLRESGFIDAEKTVGGQRVLRQFSSNAYRQADELARQSKEHYFELIAEKVSLGDFNTKNDEKIMRWVSEGHKIHEIVKMLNTTGFYIDRKTVRYTIRRYETRWKIKHWQPKQMNLKAPIR